MCEPVIVAPYEPGHYALLIEGLDSGTYYNVKMSIVSDSGLTGTAATSNFITSRKNTFPSSINLKSVARVNGSESAFPTGVGFPLRVDNTPVFYYITIMNRILDIFDNLGKTTDCKMASECGLGIANRFPDKRIVQAFLTELWYRISMGIQERHEYPS